MCSLNMCFLKMYNYYKLTKLINKFKQLEYSCVTLMPIFNNTMVWEKRQKFTILMSNKTLDWQNSYLNHKSMYTVYTSHFSITWNWFCLSCCEFAQDWQKYCRGPQYVQRIVADSFKQTMQDSLSRRHDCSRCDVNNCGRNFSQLQNALIFLCVFAESSHI